MSQYLNQGRSCNSTTQTLNQTLHKRLQKTLILRESSVDLKDGLQTREYKAWRWVIIVLSHMTCILLVFYIYYWCIWIAIRSNHCIKLFLPSSTPENFISHLRQEQDPLSSAQYAKYTRDFPQDTSGQFVYIDAHVLHTPVIVDLDKDGHDDIIIPVSYYFDQ